MLRRPLVSIIIPAYNSERYIARAIESARNQTYENTEIIVVDDGSTDRTAEIVKSFQDPRIRYIYQENKDVGAACNHGIKESRGEYVTFLAADDEYLPEKVEKEVAFLEQNPECQVVYCNLFAFYEYAPERILRGKDPLRPSEDMFGQLLRSPAINPYTLMYRRGLFDEVGMFDERRPHFPEDWEFPLRIARSGAKFGYIDECLIKVQMRENSKGATDEFHFMSKKYMLEVLENLFSSMSVREREKYDSENILRDLKWKIALTCLLNNNLDELDRINQEAFSPARKFLLCVTRKWVPSFFRITLLRALRNLRRLYKRKNFRRVNLSLFGVCALCCYWF